jgi:spermidine/putrescine transport system permease protein
MRKSQVLLTTYVLVVVTFLMAPIVIIVLFSFNGSAGLSFPIRSLSLRWYQAAVHDDTILLALRNSLIVGGVALAVVAVIGGPAAWAIARYRFPGRSALLATLTAPVALPGLFLGIALLSFFSRNHVRPSLLTVTVAHVLYTLGYFILVAVSRFAGIDPQLDEAARTLGASRLASVRLVIWPLVRPALLASLVLCLALSLDEFVITFFVIGPQNTLPIVIFSNVRTTVTPEINAVATFLLVVSWLAVGLAAVLIRGRERRRRTSPIPLPLP